MGKEFKPQRNVAISIAETSRFLEIGKNQQNVLGDIMFLCRKILTLVSKMIHESGQYVIFEYDSLKQGEGQISPGIRTFTDYSEIPDFIRKEVLSYKFIHPLYYRIRSHQATLLCIHTDVELIAYGWIQSWAPFKQKFGIFGSNGTMLGPYWTHSKHRGKGYYGKLLDHSIALSDKNFPMIIYTTPDNHASVKGIRKAGFKFVGNYQITTFFRTWAKHKKLQ